MHNMNWDDIRYCLAVVNCGSLTAAAQSLGVNHTTVSRRISALENQLGAPLFDRSTAGWLITPLGDAIIPAAQEMQEQAFAIGRRVKANYHDLAGTVRVTAVDSFVEKMISPGLKSFMETYPEINIELMVSSDNLDLTTHAADIAFRITSEPPPNVVGKKIATIAHTLYATQEVYERYLLDPDNVAGISWLQDNEIMPAWADYFSPPMRMRYRVNSFSIIYQMAHHGLGFAMLPCGIGDADPTLMRIPGFPLQMERELWALSHVDLRTTARIRMFRDYVIDAMLDRVPLIEGERPNYAQEEGITDAPA